MLPADEIRSCCALRLVGTRPRGTGRQHAAHSSCPAARHGLAAVPAAGQPGPPRAATAAPAAPPAPGPSKTCPDPSPATGTGDPSAASPRPGASHRPSWRSQRSPAPCPAAPADAAPAAAGSEASQAAPVDHAPPAAAVGDLPAAVPAGEQEEEEAAAGTSPAGRSSSAASGSLQLLDALGIAGSASLDSRGQSPEPEGLDATLPRITLLSHQVGSAHAPPPGRHAPASPSVQLPPGPDPPRRDPPRPAPPHAPALCRPSAPAATTPNR